MSLIPIRISKGEFVLNTMIKSHTCLALISKSRCIINIMWEDYIVILLIYSTKYKVSSYLMSSYKSFTNILLPILGVKILLMQYKILMKFLYLLEVLKLKVNLHSNSFYKYISHNLYVFLGMQVL